MAEIKSERKKNKAAKIASVAIPIAAALAALAVLLAAALIPQGDGQTAFQASSRPAGGAGEVVILPADERESLFFGSYEQDNDPANGPEKIEWIVLARQGDAVLLISRYVLDCRPYNATYNEMTWDTCGLREWLNGEFFDAAFTPDEQKAVLLSSVDPDDNPQYNTDPGKAARDKVFIPGIADSKGYFADDGARRCVATACAVSRGADADADGNCRWWLRAPGGRASHAAGITMSGAIDDFGYNVDFLREGVRPMIWFKP